jgi:hypothetical protein
MRVSVLKSGTEVEFDSPRVEVFQAMLDALPECNMKLKASDAESGHIEAVTSMNMMSWGEKIRIDLAEAAPGRTKATISSGNRAQLVTWGRNKKNLDKLVERTSAHLGSAPAG